MTALQRFILASGLANLADGVAVVAWAWVASILTRDAFLIALAPVALRLPWFLFALPAGILADRVDRRRLILWMDVARGLAFACAAGALWLALPIGPAPASGVAVPWLFAVLLAAALAVGTAEVFRDNAAQTMLPAMVPHAGLERANGRLWSVELIANALVGPVLGAFLIAAALPLPFALNAAAYGAAVLLVLGIAGQFRPQPSGPRDWRRELGEGFAFLRGSPLLLALALTSGFWNLFHHMNVIALVLHAQENLGASAEVYGLMLAGGAVGGVLGSLLGEGVARRLGPARTMQWMLAASPLGFVAIALAPGPVAVAVTLAFLELTGLIWNVVSVSTRQRMIPDALMGRVNSIYRLLAWGMIPLGMVLSGLIVQVAEGPVPRETALTLPFWVAAAGSLALTALAWRPLARGFAAS
jgi:MFS family permease